MITDKRSQPAKEWSLEDYLDLVLRRKFVILAVFLLVLGVVLAYSLTRPDVYSASVTFSTETTPDASFGSSMPYYYYQMSKPVEYYQALMNSGLYRDKIITAAAQDSLLLTRGSLAAEELNRLIGGISLSKEEYSDLMYMGVRAFDPIVAYRIADIAATAYKDRAREIQEEQARMTVEYVNKQIEVAEGNLETSERQLQEFRAMTKFTATNANDGIIQRLNELENKITEIVTQRELAQANLDVYNERLSHFENQQSASLLDNEAPEIVQMRRDIERLQNQKNELEENGGGRRELAQLDAEIVERKKNLREMVLQHAKTDDAGVKPAGELQELAVYQERKIEEELNLFTLKNQERYYISLRENYRKQHPNMLEHSIELAKMQRARAVSETLYNFLLQKGEEAKIKAATGTGGVKVISPASIPEMPISKNTMRQIFIGLVLGLGLGIGLAFVLDMIDKSINTPEEVERYLGLSVVGAIPNISTMAAKGKADKKPAVLKEGRNGHAKTNGQVNPRIHQLLPSLGSKNAFVEAYRNLRTDLQFVNVDNPVKSLMLTSSTPGEGKSLNTANLAISFAELGKKVLVVDCDLRKPMQHTIFQVEKKPGITDYLARGMAVETIIQKTAVTGLSVITAGTTPPNPAEMLDSLRMNELVEQLSSQFDLVLYDTPPLIAVSDPKILAPKVGNVLLLVRAGKPNYHIVQDAYERLNKVDTKVIGVVLNGVGTRKGYGYYYRYNYYYNHDYYTSNSDKKESRKKPYNKPRIIKAGRN